jgi:dTDP-4-dehydrorhamnose reductase
VTKVLVLGATGMLGSMVARVLSQNPELDVSGTVRDRRLAVGDEIDSAVGTAEIDLLEFDAAHDPVADLLAADDYAWIVNAIGVIVPSIDERDPASVARAIELNAAFPHRLAAARGGEQRVIQIATDGVFSGLSGPYAEADAHDAIGVYGRSKSLGEVAAPGFLNLRCSVIGPERSPAESLLSWLLSQPSGARITGYTNHRWNGVTTWHFARLCEAVISGSVGELPSPLHVVPGDALTKAELLELAGAAFGRSDVAVTRGAASEAVDRRLTTTHPEANHRLWAEAGYPSPPEIGRMIDELAAVERRGATGSG